MSKSYFNYLQPTIVRLSNDESLPENLRGHYFVNVNIVGIKYFSANYLLIENGNGGYMYMLTNDLHKIRLSENDALEVIDVPRAYLVISDEFVESQEDFSSWIISAIADNSYFVTGTEKFKPGIDFYINDVLYNYLIDHEVSAVSDPEGLKLNVLPDYLSQKFEITKYWQQLDIDESLYNNFKYFNGKNHILDLNYDEEDLRNIPHTFFKTIDDMNLISDEGMLKLKNQIYSRVIKYYKDNEEDCATTAISLILGSATYATIEGVSNCGCNSSANSGQGIPQGTCLDNYKAAMFEWMKGMLGDSEFYKDWFWIEQEDSSLIPNIPMIDALILLLEELLDTGWSLAFIDKPLYGQSNCQRDLYAETDALNRVTIQNYITLLNWVKEGCIDNNTNKIKVIGEKFADLLPFLKL